MKINATQCCALAHLCQVSNDININELKRIISLKRIEMKTNKDVGISYGTGQTAMFTIVSPGEDRLENVLKECGFEFQYEFARRVGYPDGMLKYYLLDLRK